LQNKMLSNSIERAQRKVEENNFGIRKRLLEYDDVMNDQRTSVYALRRDAISGDKIEIDIQNMMLDTANIILDRTKGMPYPDFAEYVMAQLSIDLDFDAEFYEKAKPAEIAERLCAHMEEVYHRRMDTLAAKVNPIIREVYEKQGAIYQNIAIPVSDGRKQMTLSVNLKKAYETDSKEVAKTASKNITLYQIDEHWKEHLREMDDLKQSVQNAAYEQKDPIVVYKIESYDLFANMLESLYRDVLSFLLRAFIPLRDSNEVPASRAMQRRTDMSQMRTTRPGDLSTNGEQRANTPVKAEKKVGRNDPCPCGSGKKYKNCHGQGLV
ncbi:MAG: SEC-C domain-containing protein, partial [Bacteroidales bacterium]|nr:SEC-C domain-containing protein [Bacteroidales bacterium]